MATLASGQVVALHRRGDGGVRVALYAVTNVTAADTYDLTADFRALSAAYFVPMSGTALAAALSSSGTVVTFGTAGLSADAGYLFAVGAQR